MITTHLYYPSGQYTRQPDRFLIGHAVLHLERVMQYLKKSGTRRLRAGPGWLNTGWRTPPTVDRPAPTLGTAAVMHRSIALLDVSPVDWRILVLWTPDIAVERLARDIGSGRCRHDGLRARARDLRAHLRPEIRERARTDFFPALDMGDDGLGPAHRFD